MLVLTRFKDQGVWLIIDGHKVRISLIDVYDHGKVRLGFEAPEEVKIYRDEVYERVLQEGEHGLRADYASTTGQLDPGVPATSGESTRPQREDPILSNVRRTEGVDAAVRQDGRETQGFQVRFDSKGHPGT